MTKDTSHRRDEAGNLTRVVERTRSEVPGEPVHVEEFVYEPPSAVNILGDYSDKGEKVADYDE